MLRKMLSNSILIACSLSASGCTTTASVSASSSLTAQDLNFLTAASELIEFDRAECQIVDNGGFSDPSRATADTMCADADQTMPQLQQLAQSNNVTLPTTLDYGLETEVLQLDGAYRSVGPNEGVNQQTATDQNVVFLTDQIGSHENALAIFRDEAKNGSLPALRGLAAQTAPIVDSNLTRLLTELQQNG